MRWTRKIAAALMLLGAAPTGMGPSWPIPADDPTTVLLTVAEVGATRAAVWMRAQGAEEVTLQYTPADGGEMRTAVARPDPSRDWTAAVALADLRPGTRYRYAAHTVAARSEGTFATTPAADADVPVRLAWSGDLGGAGNCRDVEDGYPIFQHLRRRAPDLFLFVGDTIYADHPCGRAPHIPGAAEPVDTLGGFYDKHRYNRADRGVQAFFRETPVYAIWDDHEVRNNFVGPLDPLTPLGRRAFQDYFAIAGVPDEPGRLYRRVRWGRHVDVFLLDTRQYRSPNAQPDGPDKTMLGPAQLRWLLDGVTTSDATWKVVVTPVPLGLFTGGAVSDSWSSANVLGYPRPGNGFVHERDAILATLARQGVRNVVVLSGDVHHAELLRHHPVSGYVLHEFIAGPLAARRGYPRFLDRSLGSRSLGSLGWSVNFGELVADGDALQARIVDGGGSVRASLRVQSAAR